MKIQRNPRGFVWCGFALALGMAILPVLLLAADNSAIVGNWQGVLDLGAQGKLKLVVHISQAKDGSLTGTLDSPDQGASGIPITAITYKEPKLHFECGSIGGSYDGEMSKGKSEITGEWKQGGASLSLTLHKAA